MVKALWPFLGEDRATARSSCGRIICPLEKTKKKKKNKNKNKKERKKGDAEKDDY